MHSYICVVLVDVWLKDGSLNILSYFSCNCFLTMQTYCYAPAFNINYAVEDTTPLHLRIRGITLLSGLNI